jgi:hypothetical protein
MYQKILLGLTALLISFTASADLLTFTGQYAIAMEEDSAAANQAIYDQLLALGCPDTSLDTTSAACNNAFTQSVWFKVRELVHTANDLCDPLDNCGSSEFSLNVDLTGLGNVLRWHTAEEFSTQSDMADSFLGGQLSSLQSRVSAIRSGATGFNISGIEASNDTDWITLYNAEFVGANSGDKTPAWSPWGGFLNASFTEGSQEASSREDAYDFDGKGFNGGFDYRLTNTWVVGTTFAAQFDRIDFDSSKSTVDGEVKMDAYSLIPFVLYQAPEWFFLGSLGYQQATFKTERSIRYNSNNINIPDTNPTAISKNKANIYTASTSTGYTWPIPNYTALSIEPSLTVNYQKTIVDEFSEKDLQNDGFNLLVEKQDFDSLETIVALRIQHVFSSRIGVIVPFIQAQKHTQLETDTHIIHATYVNSTYSGNTASQFAMKADAPEREYVTYTAGASFILRGAQQRTAGGPASGGLQGFISFSTVKDIVSYEQETIAGGLRYEF